MDRPNAGVIDPQPITIDEITINRPGVTLRHRQSNPRRNKRVPETASSLIFGSQMATPQARREALGPLATQLLQSIPKIAFVSAIVISTLTPPQPLMWMVYVFFYGESGAHMNDDAPPLVRFIGSDGRTPEERYTDSKWFTLLHVLPGKQSIVVDPRGIKN